MKLSELLDIIHKYVLTKESNYEFMCRFAETIMREPNSDEEENDDERNVYYPFQEKTDNKSYRDKIGRYYTGERKIPVDDAKKILTRFDGLKFGELFDDLEKDVRSKLVREINVLGIKCDFCNVVTIIIELIKEAIDNLAESRDEFEIPNNLRVETERDLFHGDYYLKSKYGVKLLIEANYTCPNDNCARLLKESTEEDGVWVYTIVKVDPAVDSEEVSNLIALCPQCGAKHSITRDAKKISRMKEIKKKLEKAASINDVLEDEKVVDGLGKIISRLSKMNFDDESDLKYDPVGIKKKIKASDNYLLYSQVKHCVSYFYMDLEELFKQAQKEGFKYNQLCSQIRWQYENLKEENLSQEEIYDALSEWLKKLTNENFRYCNIVIAFFVQKCEVFDEITE